MKLRGAPGIRSWIRRPRERGQMIILFALLFVPVTVIIGVVAVDASMWQSERRGAQKDADLAALAGAYELLEPVPVAANADAKAREYGDLNDESGTASVIEPILIDDTCFEGRGRLDSVRLNIDHDSQTFFAGAFGLSIAPEIGAHARACAGSIVSRKGLRPYGVESEPICLDDGTCQPAADTDCFVAKVVNGVTIMVPRFGAWCQLDDGSADPSTSTRGLLDLSLLGDVCSDGGRDDIVDNVLNSSGATCSVGDTVIRTGGARPGQDTNAMQDLLDGNGIPPVADGSDCDVEFAVPPPGTDNAGIDDFEEVVERTDGGPPGPSADGVYALRDCVSPRVLDIIVIGNFATDPTIKAFAAFYVLGCKDGRDTLTPPEDVLPNKCGPGTGPGGQVQLWGIFLQKLDHQGDAGEYNEFGNHTITLAE